MDKKMDKKMRKGMSMEDEMPMMKMKMMMDVSDENCENMNDYTVDDEVEFMGKGKMKNMSVDDNGKMRGGVEIHSVKLSPGKKVMKKEGKKSSLPEAFKTKK